MDEQQTANAGEEDMIRQMFSRAANTIVEASTLRKEVQALAEQVSQLTKVVEELKGQNEGLKTELENVRKERDDARQKLWQEEQNHSFTKSDLDSAIFQHRIATCDLTAMEEKWKTAVAEREHFEAEAMKFEEFLKRANTKLAEAKAKSESVARTLGIASHTLDDLSFKLDSIDFGEVKQEFAPVEETKLAETGPETGEYDQGKEYGYSEEQQRYGWWNKQGRDEEGRFQTFPQVAKSVDSE